MKNETLNTLSKYISLYFIAFGGLFGLTYLAFTSGLVEPAGGTSLSLSALIICIGCFTAAIGISFRSMIGYFAGIFTAAAVVAQIALKLVNATAVIGIVSSLVFIALWALLAYGIYFCYTAKSEAESAEGLFTLPEFKAEEADEKKAAENS